MGSSPIYPGQTFVVKLPYEIHFVVRTSPIRVSVLMEALLVLLLSYGTHPISIYLLVGQQDLQVAVACRWPANGLPRSTAALPTYNRSHMHLSRPDLRSQTPLRDPLVYSSPVYIPLLYQP